MAKNYKTQSYFADRPDVVRIFDDLEAFHNFCRMEMLDFNEAHLYNHSSYAWRAFEKSQRPKLHSGDKSPHHRARHYNGERISR